MANRRHDQTPPSQTERWPLARTWFVGLIAHATLYIIPVMVLKVPQIVIDTNVLIAALRSKRGASAKLLSLLGTGSFTFHLSVPLVLEYEEVILRQRATLDLTYDEISDFIDSLCALAEHHKIHFLWRPFLRDEDDAFVLELAVAARCHYIVTYNVKDFEGAEQFGIRAISPKIFLQIIGVIS